MSSGLEHLESGEPVYDSDTIRMLFLIAAKDMAAYAEARPLSAPPGSQFQYSTATSMILSDIMTRALTLTEDPHVRLDAMMQFIRGRFLTPFCMSSISPESAPPVPVARARIIDHTPRTHSRI